MYCKYAKDQATRSPGSKCLTQTYSSLQLHFALQFDTAEVLLDTGVWLLNLKNLAITHTQPYCTALLGLHTFTRCDTTRAFRGNGKVKPIKLLQKMTRYIRQQTVNRTTKSIIFYTKPKFMSDLEVCMAFQVSHFTKS